MSLSILAGSTDVTLYADLVLAATGAPATALDVTTLDLQYTRTRAAAAAKADATLLAAANSAHTDGGAFEINATYSPGMYRVDWPDAAFAAGAAFVELCVTGATLLPWRATVMIDAGRTLADGAITTAKFAAGAIDAAAIADNAIDAGALAGNCITAAKIADGAIDAGALAGDLAVYRARIDYRVDAGGEKDCYRVAWEKNGVPVAYGSITLPTILAYDDVDDGPLIAATPMGWDAAGQMLTYNAIDAERAAAGRGLKIIVTATIDAAVRTDVELMSRDL